MKPKTAACTWNVHANVHINVNWDECGRFMSGLCL